MDEFPETAQRFFFLYSRMEFAIKKAGWINKDASANWDQFSRELGRAFYADILHRDIAAHLRAQPPRKQIVIEGDDGRREPDWKDGNVVTNTKTLFDAVRTARNNLFHGGKFRHGYLPDSARDEQLLRDCIAVLEAACDAHEGVRQALHQPA